MCKVGRQVGEQGGVEGSNSCGSWALEVADEFQVDTAQLGSRLIVLNPSLLLFASGALLIDHLFLFALFRYLFRKVGGLMFLFTSGDRDRV